MKKTRLLLIFLGLLLSSMPAFARDIKSELAVQNNVWALAIENLAAPQDEQGVTRLQRDLLTSIRVDVENKRYQAAIEQLEDYQANNSNEPPSAIIMGLYGQLLLAEDRADEAVNVLLAAHDVQANDMVILQNLATAYLLQNNLNEAQIYIAKSIQLGLNNAQVYGQLGYINLQTALPMSAIAAYQKALMFEPQNKQWARGLLLALIYAQSHSEASALIDQLLSDSPQDAQLWLQRAQLSLDLKRDTQAITSLETAILLGQKSRSIFMQLALLHLKSGSPERTVDIVSLYMPQFFEGDEQGITFEQINAIALSFMDNRDWLQLNRLLTLLKQQSLGRSQQAAVYFIEANINRMQGRFDAAIVAYVKLLEVSPSNGRALLELAGIYEQKDQQIKAEMLYQRAITFDEFEEPARIGLAQIAINRKDFALALRLLKQVYNKNPGLAEISNNIQVLENIVKNS
jgi:tetratricopeptide (TPR) repeat protein